ncbi:hypothetical protein ACFFRR_001329 [Megaselia abdita]
MNSFALHLVVLLLIGSYSIEANNEYTTQKPPSLPSPPVVPSLSTIPTRLAHDHYDDAKSSITDVGNLKLHRQTTKTPRMIQRMVAGHLHLESIPTSTTTTPSTTTVEESTKIIKENRKPYRISSTYRRHNITILTTTTTPKSTTAKRNVDDINSILDDDDIIDDAALLDSADLGNWDNDILRLSAGGGKETTLKKKKKEPTKTLSEQVKDGKYGLIEKELFSEAPSRPGILSYHRNKEVPYDHEGNFGGLNKEDIWLAEDHLLVIKGGDLNENDNKEPWRPLDDYVAPERQIKIPSNPKVPPPFPVQLEDNGPIQFLGNNQFADILPFDRNATSGENYSTPQSLGDDQKNFITGSGVIQNIANTKTNSYIYPPPYSPWVQNNKTVPLAIGPFLHVNRSLEDTLFEPDDDDMSMFYPPPYSFVYKNNYSNPVPPGPLVPGIVVPPPPNAFARLKPKLKSSTSTPPTIIEVVTYTPKTIIITPVAATPPSTTSTTSKTTSSTTTKTTTTAIPIQIQKQIIYAVPQTQYIPTTKKPDTSSGTLKSNPIYYEYFDSKKEERPKKTTPGRRPIQNFNHIIQHPQMSPPPKKFIYEDYLYITPKPEVRPNGLPSATYLPFTNKGNFKTKQLQSFEHEINVIRQALNFYKNQQLRDNNIPRTPKTKSSIFEYTLDPPSPLQFDVEPFKPMVTYSPPVNDANGFHAISIEPTTTAQPTQQRVGAKYLQAMARDNFDDSPHQWVVDKSQKMRVGPAPMPQRTFGYQYDQPPLRQNNRFYEEPFSRPVNNPVRSIMNNYRPNLQWSLENDTYINYLPNYRPAVNSNSEYVNHRNAYNDRIISLPNRLGSQQPIQQQQQQQAIPLHRDTLVNYRYPLPPINPDSEYIPLHLHSSNSNRNSQYQPLPYNSPTGGGVLYNRPSQQFGGEAQSNVYYIQNTSKYNNRN